MAYRISPRSDAYCQEDQLGFDKYVDTLHGIIKDKDFTTPFSIGIYGKWGSGKTSFMRLLEKRLLEEETTPYIIPAWFNPWRYKKEEHLIIPFLKTIESEIDGYVRLKKTKIKKQLLNGLIKAAKKIGHASEAIMYGVKADLKMGPVGLQFDAAKSIDREDALAKKKLEEAKKLSDELSSIYYDIVTELKSAVNEQAFRIAVFIDDLDRCLPEKAIELLESIKLFIDLEGYLFIIGVDKSVVTKGISYHYRFFESSNRESEQEQIISPDDYLDKMIQLPFEIPPIEPGKKRMFIESLLGDEAEFNEHSDIIEVGIGENPRTLKRFVNFLAFMVRLAETIKRTIIDQAAETLDHIKLIEENFIPILYIKWAIIVFRFPKDYQDIKGNKKRLIEMQKAARIEATYGESEKESETQGLMQLNERLMKVLEKGEQFPDDEWLLDRFIHLTESTIISGKETEKTKGVKQFFDVGEMVRIPKGPFLYGDDKFARSIDYDYDIDVFPITNKQYKEFLDENKEVPPPYLEDDFAKPYSWDKKTRSYPKGKSNHPVVLVSWEDADLFCIWRSQKEGKKYRLPSEEEWEKAARGIDGREYPWGNQFDKDNCNVSDSGIGGTTEVNRYSDGTSPFGCYDMAGNVWEWTARWFGSTQKEKVLRGGSYDSDRSLARCAIRDKSNPVLKRTVLGFRCVRPLEASPHFSVGPPSAQLVERVLGPPPESSSADELVRFNLPFEMYLAWDPSRKINSFMVHREALPYFEKAFSLIKSRELEHLVKFFGGSYSKRKARLTLEWTLHSWGIAVDINPQENKLEWGPDRWEMDERVAEAFEEAGFYWRGRLGFDAMHFNLSPTTLIEIAKKRGIKINEDES